MECNHSIEKLLGNADGILCRGCGARFKSFDEIHPADTAAEKPAEKPKRKPAKKAE